MNGELRNQTTSDAGFPQKISPCTLRPPSLRVGFSRDLLVRLSLSANTVFLSTKLGSELRAEVLRLEYLANLDLGIAGHRVRTALDPLDRFFLRLHLEQPESGYQLLGLGERTIDHGPLVTREPHTRTLRARVQSFAGKHDARLDKLFIVCAHLGQHLLRRHQACFGVPCGLYHHHESHLVSLMSYWFVSGAGFAGSVPRAAPLTNTSNENLRNRHGDECLVIYSARFNVLEQDGPDFMSDDENPIGAPGDSKTAVTEGSRFYRLLVESVRDYGIFVLDPTGRVASWNEGAQRIKGYSADEIIGRHFSTFYPEEDKLAEKPKMELEGATRDGRFEDEGWRIRKDGTRFWAYVVITALRTESGELVGFAKVTRDLTERRAAEQKAIEDAKRITKAELANRAKSEFLAAMSHELRTPLNAIAGYADLLELGIAGTVNAQQRDYIGRIRRSQQHLLGIINDLLNYSRIEAGQVTYDQSPVSLNQVVDAVVPLL